MSGSQSFAGRLVRWLPLDLAAVVVMTALVGVTVFTPVIQATPIRVPVGIIFVLFVPGYALVSALFPERYRSATNTDESNRTRWLGNGSEIDGVDRLSLSVVVSVVLVSSIGVAMNYTPWGIQLGPVLAAVSAVTLVATYIAVRRRHALPRSVAFSVPVGRWAATVREAIRRPDTRADVVLNGLLLIAVGIALVSVGFAVVGPGFSDDAATDADGYSSLSLLDDDGDLLASESAAIDETDNVSDVAVGIENNEHRTVTYTLVALEQQLDDEGDVTDQRELERFEAEVDHGDVAVIDQELEPSDADNTQVIWLLYPTSVPDEPSANTAEAHVTLSLPDASEE